MFTGRTSKKMKCRRAIQYASQHRYYSPEERAADEAALREQQATMEARDAIKATRATRPKVPPEYKAIRAACRSELDCDHLSAALEAGWPAKHINFLARQLSVAASRIPNKETPAAIRMALSMIQGWPAGQYYSYKFP